MLPPYYLPKHNNHKIMFSKIPNTKFKIYIYSTVAWNKHIRKSIDLQHEVVIWKWIGIKFPIQWCTGKSILMTLLFFILGVDFYDRSSVVSVKNTLSHPGINGAFVLVSIYIHKNTWNKCQLYSIFCKVRVFFDLQPLDYYLNEYRLCGAVGRSVE